MTGAPGETIGKYQVIRNLASGSQGMVCLAYDPELDRQVALKVLHPHLATPEVIERFRREAQIVASISHPNIAGITEIGEHNGSHYIVIEYVPHGAAELIRQGPLVIERAASIAYQTAIALELARTSRREVTHHDIKPDNLLLTSLGPDGLVKIIDFGIAHAADMAPMTQAGSQWGTPLYMPPEQWNGERGDTRSDVYSLGIVLYQMLSGQVPFDSDAANSVARQTEIARQHLEDEPASLRSIREDISEDLEAIVERCMSKSPQDRYQTPGQLADALSAMFGLTSQTASQTGPSLPLVVSRDPRPPRRNSLPLIAAGGFGAMIIISVVALVLLQPDDGTIRPAPVAMIPTVTETPTPTATPSPVPTRSPTPTFTPPTPVRTPLVTIQEPTATPTSIPQSTTTPTPEPILTHEVVAAKPDLELAEESFAWHPQNPSLGDPVTFSITLNNHGGNAPPSRLGYRVYSTANPVDPVTSGTVHVSGVRAGERIDISFDWIAQAGYHNLEIEVDASHVIEESAESNNIKTGLIYPGPLLADLVVSSLDWSPAAPIMGNTVNFPVTIVNQGEGRAPATTVQLFVGEVLLGEAGLPPILPGASEILHFPWIAKVGNSTLRVLADPGRQVTETDEGNNELTVSYDATAFVDLVVHDISWKPARPSVGQDVTFTVIVGNRGNMDAWESSVELSAISIEGAASIGNVQHVTIPAGDSAIARFRWQAEPGEFTINAAADAQGAIRESNEDNNAADVRYDQTVLADLVVTGIDWSPDHPAVGQEVTITVTASNNGDGDAPASDVSLIVDDLQHGSTATLPGVPAGSSYSVSFMWIAEVGEHRFRAYVDQMGDVAESDESNNVSGTFRYVGSRIADLAVRSINWEPESPSVGEAVTISAAIENRGDAAARDFSVSFRDRSSARSPMERRYSGELAPGTVANVSFEWTAEVGSHQFVVLADSRNEVTEAKEDNNEYRLDYDATVNSDLIVSRITPSPQRPSIGEDMTIRVTVSNQGHGRAGSFIITIAFWEAGRQLDEINKRVEGVDAGASRSFEFPWVARVGSQTITVTADSRGVISETDETNNVLEETVLTALSDLVVAGVQVDNDSPFVGDSVGISVRVANQGRGDSGRFTVSLYVDGAEQFQQSRRIDFLNSGGSVHTDFRWDAVQGCHNFIVIVDGADDVPEEDEGNNRSQEFEMCVASG